MLIHHLEAETHGFQGLFDQNDVGKAQVPEKSILLENNLFSIWLVVIQLFLK